jgi:hypothetical protein
VIGVVIAVAKGASLATYLVAVFLPSMPAFLDTLDLVQAYRKASADKREVERSATAAFERGLTDGVDDVLADCRQIQDRIFEVRKEEPLPSEMWYRVRRPAFEKDMREAATVLAMKASQVP